MLKSGLLPLTQTAMRWGKIAYHDFEGVAVELDERERLVKDLGDCEVMILRNHGLLSVGQEHRPGLQQHLPPGARLPDPASGARLQQRNLDAAAAVIAKSNAQLTSMPSPDAKGRNRPHGSLEWPALKRMLDRRDPSYRT